MIGGDTEWGRLNEEGWINRGWGHEYKRIKKLRTIWDECGNSIFTFF